MMAEEQKPQQAQTQQTQQQLQALLRETVKENKSLQNKNTKLQGKYVQVFKELKLIKKDHSTFVSFLSKYLSNETGVGFQQLAFGQYQSAQIEQIAEQKEAVYKNRIQQLERTIEASNKARVIEVEDAVLKKKLEIIGDYEQRTKGFKQEINKEIHGYLKELQSLRKTTKIQAQQITQLKSSLQTKTNELSKMGKEKLKLQHHLNNLRKKQIAEQLSDDKQKKQEQLMNERHEFLSLRQQVESLLTKRDQLRRELKEKQQELLQAKRINLILEEQIQKLKQQSKLQDQKYQLVRECSLEQLENLILSHHSESVSSQLKSIPQQKPKENVPKALKKQEAIVDEQEEIQRQYLKNVLLRYIKAQVSGSFDQALTLLEIIGTILRLDPESVQALNSYKNKRKQWWYIKY